jgi:anaerobic magnesium-protoporphyrin IX monomethyl ester cyclase
MPHQVKPLGLVNKEISPLKSKLIEGNKLNHHKNRYVLLPVSFNWQEFVQHNLIRNNDELLVIEYNRKNVPRALTVGLPQGSGMQ